MTDVEATATSFTSSSRTGRRNALPDIRSSGASSEALELPEQLQTLSVKEGNELLHLHRDLSQ